ncbi:hypothetical protein [Enterobacter ludwigii]|uniref:hypothetical protein n=1 Tax=Enterobacter ludwigii TaxID=299767 RepID=UPI001FFB7E7F|nr:hypothetical protein [Enterobacter ludwigii]
MKQKFIEWFTKNNNGCSPAMEDDRSFVREKTQQMFEAYQAGVAEGEARCTALAAENAGLKSEVPMGAIENGRAFAERLEAYPFECQGGNLNMCSDWQELRRCFEHLSEWAMHGQSETPATDAFLAEVRASGVRLVIDYHNERADALRDIDRNGAFRHESAALDAIDVLMKIRKGVQS